MYKQTHFPIFSAGLFALAACSGQTDKRETAGRSDTGAASIQGDPTDTGDVPDPGDPPDTGQDSFPAPVDLSAIRVGLHESEVRYVAEDPDNRAAVVPVAPLSAPEFGASVSLGRFNDTPVRRVNEMSVGNHLYSQLQAFSKNSQYLLILEEDSGVGTQWRIRDTRSGELVYAEADMGAWKAPRWHPAHLGLLVFYDMDDAGRVRLRSLQVDTGQLETLYTFPADVIEVLSNQSFDELSRDGRWLAGEWVNTAGDGVVFSFDLQAHQLAAMVNLTELYRSVCTPDRDYGMVDPDWTGVSPLGHYLVVQWGASGVSRCNGLETFDIETGAFLGRVTSEHPHGDLQVLADGVTEVFVSSEFAGPTAGQSFAGGEPGGRDIDAWYPALSYRTLPGVPDDQSDPVHLILTDWNFEHMSCRGPFGYCLVTAWNNPDNGLYDPLEDELYIVALDGSGVIRLGQHRSSGDDYWSQPRASMSTDGRYVIFDSDWDQPGTNTAVFVMDLGDVSGD